MAPFYGDMLLRALSIYAIFHLLLHIGHANTLYYSREELLLIREQSSGLTPPTDLLDYNISLNTHHGDSTSAHVNNNRTRKRGRRGGLLVKSRKRCRKPPVPSIIMANVQRLYNKMDELSCRINNQRDFRDCCVFSFTETWLTSLHPDSAMQPPGFTIFRHDRESETTGKFQGGGVCFLVNDKWCTDVKVVSSACSPDLEYITIKCRPFYLPREFTSVTLTTGYIHPRANTDHI